MTKEELMALDMAGLEERAAAIEKETADADDEALEALKAELDAIEERKNTILAEAEEKRKEAQKVIDGAGKTIEKTQEEARTMDSREIRNSKEYIDAYVEYIKGNSDGTECRALLTTNADLGSDETGTIAVPTYIEDRIRTAWENDGIMSRVTKTYFKGNLKVGVEMAATAAGWHEEGAGQPDEETLTIATVELVAKSAKKWITVSDEVMDTRGQAFLDYIYDEIEYQIVKYVAGQMMAKVASAATSGTTAPIVSEKSISSIGVADLVAAEGLVQGDATDLCFVANRGTIAAYKAAALGANYAVDPFDGMTVIPCDYFKAFSAASANDIVGVVGDLKALQANFPGSGQVDFKFDDLSLAEKDLVKIVGRMYVGIGLVQNKAFTRLKKVNG